MRYDLWDEEGFPDLGDPFVETLDYTNLYFLSGNTVSEAQVDARKTIQQFGFSFARSIHRPIINEKSYVAVNTELILASNNNNNCAVPTKASHLEYILRYIEISYAN
ncbi:22325_t:CDS:2 [Entrophospora sp. SA101]|nr:22325_t:CDS:2 [Entrophospora sp. SA101]CAJ0914767.1 12070_t:CDS:2 [Entrophospora sp. SA101]